MLMGRFLSLYTVNGVHGKYNDYQDEIVNTVRNEQNYLIVH